MPVVQITYDVPLDIAKGLTTGELKMLGTAAVKNNKQITAHIREVSRTISDGDEPVSAAVAKPESTDGLAGGCVTMLGLG
ncbi:hypothetical protein [Janibacter sp. G368]|uniref:hypothetical protein n=1 Tax=Janibacter sp. G368 TaxID=3420441 RepID=UPI003CFFD8C0